MMVFFFFFYRSNREITHGVYMQSWKTCPQVADVRISWCQAGHR